MARGDPPSTSTRACPQKCWPPSPATTTPSSPSHPSPRVSPGNGGTPLPPPKEAVPPVTTAGRCPRAPGVSQCDMCVTRASMAWHVNVAHAQHTYVHDVQRVNATGHAMRAHVYTWHKRVLFLLEGSRAEHAQTQSLQDTLVGDRGLKPEISISKPEGLAWGYHLGKYILWDVLAHGTLFHATWGTCNMCTRVHTWRMALHWGFSTPRAHIWGREMPAPCLPPVSPHSPCVLT